jgi:hypothetical protein
MSRSIPESKKKTELQVFNQTNNILVSSQLIPILHGVQSYEKKNIGLRAKFLDYLSSVTDMHQQKFVFIVWSLTSF